MDSRTVLEKALEFHGHRCWASVAGVRVGLAALEKLGVKRSGGTQLYGIVEIGEEHVWQREYSQRTPWKTWFYPD